MLQSPTLDKQKKMTSYREKILRAVRNPSSSNIRWGYSVAFVSDVPLTVSKAEKRAHIQIQKGREGEVGSIRMDGELIVINQP
ncbi:hypothetical protein J1N35_032283 [Gossypium stocksii]|uniref:Uncharacterized protein n=1 Tax=Gossypium stocksii TaxID=47602 RepID=A0A9D3ZUJ5_9ROSI|nr:hypothetical protein J1N35_032283 [Gossypium stocksii]